MEHAALHEEGRKSSLAFRTISEVAQEIDVPQHVLRFWESQFPQLKPNKSYDKFGAYTWFFFAGDFPRSARHLDKQGYGRPASRNGHPKAREPPRDEAEQPPWVTKPKAAGPRPGVEASASEHIARRIAMKLATDNAEEMIKFYTRRYNRQRQAGITQQIMEIVAGAEALK